MADAWFSGAIGGLVATAVTPIIITWLSKVAPKEPLPELTDEQKAALQRKHQSSEVGELGIYMGVGAVLSALLLGTFYGLSNLLIAMRGTGDIVIKPFFLIWIFPAVTFGFVLSARPGHWLMRRWLQNDFEEFELAKRMKGGFDTRRVLRWFVPIITIPMALLLVLSLDWYTRFEPDRVVSNGFLGFGEITHRYDDIDRVIIAETFIPPSGERVKRDRLFLIFHDGSYWSGEDASGYSIKDDPQLYKHIIEYVNSKTGKLVERVDEIDGILKEAAVIKPR